MIVLLKKIARYFMALILFLVLLVIVVVLYFFINANFNSKDITLAAPDGKVYIHFDEFDIPHIVATISDDDAFYALGFVHAKDRFWQMEFQRRVA
jgi:penicillin amidase